MKIIGTDNLASETVADKLWLDAIPDTPEFRQFAQRICDKLNERLGDFAGTYYQIVENDHRLWRGWDALV